MGISKKRAEALKKVDAEKVYSLEEAMGLVKEVNIAKFDASVDLHIRLGVDPRKADQNLRGTISLPHGTGKDKKVLVLCSPDKEEEAKAAGADFVGLDEYLQKMQGGWLEMDVIVAMASVMPKLGRLGRVLGPRGLMPNPKSGTVVRQDQSIGDAVTAIKKGKTSFRVDKYGIVHTSVGRVSFTPEKLADNAREVLTTLQKMKPSSAKGIYMKSIFTASTMSPSVKIDPKAAVIK
ncbi:MAG: 50S ribosomal protein L1 [Aureispira sp.]|nr:50S ribosomal protein L1 [Aureispira sp.]